MPPAFTRLRADDIYASGEGFGDMFWVANHVHHRDAGGMQFVDCFFRGDACMQETENEQSN